jgi:phenylalanyl-tRNA synthetase alpha chain
MEILQQQIISLETLLKNIKSEQQLNQIKSQFLGKKSEITELLKTIQTLPHDERKAFGEKINHYRKLFESLISAKYDEISINLVNQKLNAELIDFTLPYDGRYNSGNQHMINRTIDELLSIMMHLGFKSVSGPEIEDDFHNFTALNVPPLHPARQMQDTFYVDSGKILRTQTSSVQIRYMMSNTPPYYIVSVGRVYRADDVDQTHLPMFHQMECLCIDKDITLLDMKQTIHNMLKMFFIVDDVPMRFRSSYFPFTTPSMEVDMQYNNKWLELMGCGMVHQKVLKNVGIDFGYQGFAFGLGIERMAMIKHNVSDVRDFLENDIRWIRHYG